jgi:hypothetical protein
MTYWAILRISHLNWMILSRIGGDTCTWRNRVCACSQYAMFLCYKMPNLESGLTYFLVLSMTICHFGRIFLTWFNLIQFGRSVNTFTPSILEITYSLNWYLNGWCHIIIGFVRQNIIYWYLFCMSKVPNHRHYMKILWCMLMYVIE